MLKELDLLYLWHPCTQMKDHEKIPPIPMKKAQGVWLYDFSDKAYMDYISSWWVNLSGHCNPKISNAIKARLERLEHVLPAGSSHEGTIKLSQRFCTLSGFDRCFYADNGSSIIEAALKMSFHYHLNKGKKKSKFLSLTNSYHGETLGALSVGDVRFYKQTYKPLFLEDLSTEAPSGSDFKEALKELKTKLEQHANSLCAFIVEPLVQCAGDMDMYEPSFLNEAIKFCHHFDVQVIFDEIAVGFGRTGKLFAMHHREEKPDYLCLSKSIMGGFLPLAVVLVRDEIYNAFYAPYKDNKTLLHSHSYTGNTLATAAANEVLDIFETQNVLEKDAFLSLFIKQEPEKLKEFHFLDNFRQCGTIYASDTKSQIPRAELLVYEKALQKKLLLRPLGNMIHLMPPYTITKDETSYVVDGLMEILKEFKT